MNSLPNPFAREKAGNKAATVFVHIAQNTQRMSGLRSQFATQVQMRKYVYRTVLSILFHGRTGWAEFFFADCGDWYTVVVKRKQKIPSQVFIALSKCTDET